MRRFTTYGPALVVLFVAAFTLFAAPEAIRQMRHAQVTANVELARQRLSDDGNILERISEATSDIARAVKPSVVHIEAFGSERFGAFSSGAGWVYDGQGHIVTNSHVVRGATLINAELHDGHVERAEVIGFDDATDIAVLKIDPGVGLVSAARAPNAPVEPGQRVFAFGSPFGFKHSMTGGIVSGVSRHAFGVVASGGYTSFIQTDAAVNPGNSGGPLVNTSGRVIGMNTAIVTGESSPGSADYRGQSAGIGFAIPVATIESVVDQIIDRGVVLRGYIGIGLGDFQSREDEGDGLLGSAVRVTRVFEGGPAEKAGLRAGDLIVSIDEQRITNSQMLRSLVSATRPEQRLVFGVLRDGKRVELPLIVGAARLLSDGNLRPVDPDEELAEDPQLAMAERANDTLARFGISRIVAVDGGVRIDMVRQRRSRAWEMGFREGQVITEIDGRRIRTLGDFYAALDEADGDAAQAIVEFGDNERSTLMLPLP